MASYGVLLELTKKQIENILYDETPECTKCGTTESQCNNCNIMKYIQNVHVIIFG
jgi:hypothetical protein